MLTIKNFFKPIPKEEPKPKPGRPRKVKKKSGRPPKPVEEVHQLSDLPINSEGTSSALAAIADADSMGNKDVYKQKRTKWSDGDARIKMEQATLDWENKTGQCTKDMSFKTFARTMGISRKTLWMHVHPDPNQRVSIGSAGGRQSLVKQNAQQFVVDVIRRHDRGNDGLSSREAVDVVREIAPHLTLKQATDTLRKTIRPNFGDSITNIVKAQPTTSMRTHINIDQQWRWHQVRPISLCTVKHRKNSLTNSKY
jgi:hypothetical protein